jgi:hypothetical protein
VSELLKRTRRANAVNAQDESAETVIAAAVLVRSAGVASVHEGASAKAGVP